MLTERISCKHFCHGVVTYVSLSKNNVAPTVTSLKHDLFYAALILTRFCNAFRSEFSLFCLSLKFKYFVGLIKQNLLVLRFPDFASSSAVSEVDSLPQMHFTLSYAMFQETSNCKPKTFTQIFWTNVLLYHQNTLWLCKLFIG